MLDQFLEKIPKPARTALLRAVQRASGEGARYRYADQVERDGRRAATALRDLQLERLRQTLTEAGDRVPYWRDLFKAEGFDPRGIKRVTDISCLPILTKEIIRAQGDRMLAEGYDKAKLVLRKTGGSTGKPLVFRTDRDSLERQMAVNLRSYRMLGLREDDRIAKIWGYGKSHRLENALSPVSARLFLDAFQTSDEALAGWARQLDRFRPKAIYGYAVAIGHFARFLKRTGGQIHGLRVVATTSERLFPEMRDEIADALGAPVADMYGSHELVRIASDCLHGRMHIHMDGAVIEFDREPGNKDGPGRIIATSLLSRAQPFIRYDLGDMGTPLAPTCTCGLALPLMKLDVGKIHHIFHLPGGRTVHSAILFKRIYRLKGINAFQIRHAAPGRIEIAAVPAPGEADLLKDELARAVKRFEQDLGPDTMIETRFVQEVPRTKSGKQPPVVSDVPEDKK